MKKLLILIAFLLIPKTVLAIGTNESTNLNTVTIYVYTSDNTAKLDELKEWLDDLTYNKAYISYELINKDDNLKLYSKCKKTLRIPNNKEPLFIVGSTYFIGDNEKVREEISKAVLLFQNNNYCDLIATLKNDEDSAECLKINDGVYSSPFNYINWPMVIGGIALLLSVIILGFMAPKVIKKVEK